jgi:hypothetical protein
MLVGHGTERRLARTATSRKLQDKKPVLRRLADSIPFESFLPDLAMGCTEERKSNAKRNRIDPLILFMILILQQLFTSAIKSSNSRYATKDPLGNL